MIPGTFGSNLLELSSQKFSHGSDSVGNGDELVKPLLAHGWFVKNNGSDSGTVSWWRRVVDSNNDLELGEDFAGDGLILANEVEGTASLTIETHDFSE